MSAQRPSQRSGRRVQVITNSFEIRQLPTQSFYHYDDITREMTRNTDQGPVVVRREIRDVQRYREIMDELFRLNANMFVHHPSYDGRKNMYSSRKLVDGEYPVRIGRGEIKVKITLANTIQPSDFHNLITPAGVQKTQISTVAVALLQIIISQAPNLRHNFAPHAKSFLIQDMRDMRGRPTTANLPSGLQAWRGLFQSVRPVLGRLIINVDTATAAVYRPGPLLDDALLHMRCRDARELVRKCADRGAFKELERHYKHIQVKIPGGRRRKVDGLVERVGAYEFTKDDATATITVLDYYMQFRSITLRYPETFGVRAGKAVFPAELCEIVPGQVYTKKLNPLDTAEMVKKSVMNPAERIDTIKAAVTGSYLNYADSHWMRDAGLSVNPTPIQVQARELPPPTIKYGQATQNVKAGAWNVMNQQFVIPAQIRAWAIVCFEHRVTPESLMPFAKKLFANMRKLGIKFGKEEPVMQPGNAQNVSHHLTNAAQSAAACVPLKNPNEAPLKDVFVLVILPENAAVVRKDVKYWGDVNAGVPTQCLRCGKWEKVNDQYINNVAIKINIRCGGINSYIDTGAVQFIKQAMIVGCDVSHPSPGMKNRPSVASIVSSLDPNATRYYAQVSVQNPRQEVIDGLADMFKNALIEYGRHRNCLPSHLVVYRDGVSDGEYAQVEENEIKVIQEQVLDDLHFTKGAKISLIFIVVGKRHHIRFFPSDRSSGDHKGNCNPGLVVDSEIVHSTYPDFYLQSHSGIIGTSRPSHYVVLKNTATLPNGAPLSEDLVQQLSFALCHTYQTATRAVSIPAPVYYADRACARAEFHFNPHTQLTLDETASNVSDAFDLDQWRNALEGVKLAKGMYFV